MGLRQELKKEIGYTEDSRTCSTCMYGAAHEDRGVWYWQCNIISNILKMNILKMNVEAHGTCNYYKSTIKGGE